MRISDWSSDVCSSDLEAEERRLAARDLADAFGLPIGNAVDFWTEAALFSAAGLDALVCGPGNIAQAHTADEWVSLSPLQDYAEAVRRIIASESRRSEARRVGTEGVSTCRSRWSPDHHKKNT